MLKYWRKGARSMKTTLKHSLLVSLALVLSVASGAGGAAAAPAADGPNLLQNPGFEGGYVKQCCRTDLPPDKPPTPIDEIQLAPGWSAWWLEPGHDAAHSPTGTPAWHRPEYRSANCHFPICAPRIHSGDDAQHYFTLFSLHDAGLYQQVSGITPGSIVQFSIYMQAWSTNENVGPSQLTQDMGLRIGIDPFGGTDGFSPNVIWSAPGNSFDAWTLFTMQATAQGSSVTVFTRSTPYWGVQHNDVYLDDASLVLVGQGSVSGGGSTTTTTTTTNSAPPAPSGPDGTYTVQPGDILTRIAFKFGVTVDAIVSANHITNPNLLRVGQSLIIPGVTVTDQGGGAAPTPPPGPLTGQISYVVVAGDSLSRLAFVYDVSIERIKQLNNLKSDMIWIGQTLIIAP
jgi:LysM repeat protein